MWETRHNDQGINAELQPRSSLPRPHASMITIYLIWHVATCIKQYRKNPTATQNN